MKKILLLLLLVIFSTIIYAQNQIQGRVTDLNGMPLVGTSVFLPEQAKGTIGIENVAYSLGNLPFGKIKIQFSYVGYNTELRTRNIEFPANEFNISLSESGIKSQEVVVTGVSVSSQHESAVKIDVLNSKDLSLSGTPNFMKSLTRVPVVDMIAKGPGVSKPVIRGLSMNDILGMNNGVCIENY
jgi:iron complex outermembrane receptor protein